MTPFARLLELAGPAALRRIEQRLREDEDGPLPPFLVLIADLSSTTPRESSVLNADVAYALMEYVLAIHGAPSVSRESWEELLIVSATLCVQLDNGLLASETVLLSAAESASSLGGEYAEAMLAFLLSRPLAVSHINNVVVAVSIATLAFLAGGNRLRDSTEATPSISSRPSLYRRRRMIALLSRATDQIGMTKSYILQLQDILSGG